MKKILYLVRHAEASEPNSGLSDKYRGLTSSGMIDTTRMGRHLTTLIPKIDQIVASDAERTRMTADIFLEQFHLEKKQLILDETLYEGSPRHYLGAINGLSEKLGAVMIVGHNPSISYLAEYLCKHEFGNIPTCGVVALQFDDLTWAEISKYSGAFLFYDSPDGKI